MASLQSDMEEYRVQLQKGAIQRAYRGLMETMLALRTHFEQCCPGYTVSGLYAGYMDMTYFALKSTILSERKLKIAIVFLHEEFRFEVWLSGSNRRVQAGYWERIRQSGWDRYRLVADPQSADAILEHTLTADPDFDDLRTLTTLIKRETLAFARAVEEYLATH